MNREIKFRAWDSFMKKMDYDFEKTDYFVAKMNDKDDWKDVFLMQYTGLKDKNGFDIYEGDIVDTTNPKFDPQQVLWKVSWGEHPDNNMTGWLVKAFNTTGKTHELDKSICGGKVIGNIYENPKLLK